MNQRLFADIPTNIQEIIKKLNLINPGLNPGACFWAAVETAKVLSSSDYKPNDINQLGPLREQNYHADVMLMRNAEYEIEISKPEKLIDFLNEHLLPGHHAVADYEGDHYYNLYRAPNKDLWLFDADRQIYKQIKSPADFKQDLSAWGEHQVWDYFYLKFATKKERKADYCLTVMPIKNEILEAKINPLDDQWSEITVRESFKKKHF